jgi:hypothetical protein
VGKPESSLVALDAPTVQRVLQGLLDAWKELSVEQRKDGTARATDWLIVNEGLLAGDSLNNRLKEALTVLGLPVTESRSK